MRIGGLQALRQFRQFNPDLVGGPTLQLQELRQLISRCLKPQKLCRLLFKRKGEELVETGNLVTHDLGRAVGDGDAKWFATVGPTGRGQLRSAEGVELAPDAIGRFRPAVFLYDNYPGGVGLSAPLFDQRDAVVGAAHVLVEGCACRYGCPACVGPILASDEARRYAPKAAALRVLEMLDDHVEER